MSIKPARKELGLGTAGGPALKDFLKCLTFKNACYAHAVKKGVSETHMGNTHTQNIYQRIAWQTQTVTANHLQPRFPMLLFLKPFS